MAQTFDSELYHPVSGILASFSQYCLTLSYEHQTTLHYPPPLSKPCMNFLEYESFDLLN